MKAMMRHLLIGMTLTVGVALGVHAAYAQIVPQVTNPVPPVPPPAPLPPPSLEVPKVPKMDAPSQQQPSPRAPDRRSFNDRINDCLMAANATRLDTTERASYSRDCANR